MTHFSKILIVIGIILIISGLILHFAGNRLGWIGHLPGDIRVEKENFKFYFPITTMILLSILISGIIWLIRKLF